MVDARLGHTDFPFWRETFATSRGETSCLETVYGCAFRRYGRNSPKEYTFMGCEPGSDVLGTVRDMIRVGCRLKSLSFTTPAPGGLPVLKAVPDYRVAGDFDTLYLNRGSKTRQTLARACKGVTARVVTLEDEAACWAVFNAWVEWAGERHFMVFKGHYRRWIDLWFKREGEQPGTFLYVLESEGLPVAIFGGELDSATGEAQVHIAKHTPAVGGKAMWTIGMRKLLGEHEVSVLHCGSTADKLKRDLGMSPAAAWAPDFKSIRESVS